MQLIKLSVKLIMSIAIFIAGILTPASLQQNEQPIVAEYETEPLKAPFKHKICELVEHWKIEISEDEQFASFVDAKWDVKALGPGSKSFLVVFYEQQDDTEVAIGYLIIHSTESGALKIGEYGKGLFDSLEIQMESPLLAIYHQPFEAVYRSTEEEIVDLFTNETYPLQIDQVNQSSNHINTISHEHNQLFDDAHFNYGIHIAYFSPYEKLPWLTSSSINDQLIDDRSIETEIELQNELYYRVKSWNNSISTVFSVTSLHKWNDNYFVVGIQLDDEQTIRYIPFDTLLKFGQFYSS